MDHRKILKVTASMLLLMNASQQSIITFADHLDSGQMTEEVASPTIEDQTEDVTMEVAESEEPEKQESESPESSATVPSEVPTEPTTEVTQEVKTEAEQATVDSTIAPAVEEVTAPSNEPVIPDPNARTVCEIQGVEDQVISGVFGTSQWRIDQEGVLYIDSGTLGETTMAARAPWFSNRSLIKKIVFTGPVVANAESLGLFFDLNQLTTIENLGNLDTSQVTNMDYFFAWCRQLTSLDLTTFNTQNVRSMNYMFNGLSAMTSLNLSSFNTANVSDMSHMFYGMSALTSLDLSSFDTSNVSNMSYMFYDCSALTSLDVTGFQTANVTNFSHMFRGCSGLSQLDLSSFVTSQATDMSFMFHGCSGLQALDVTHFDTSNVRLMHYMFHGCSGLTKLDVSRFDTTNVTSMYYMFFGCSGLTELDVSNFSTSNVTTMSFMFAECINLQAIDVSGFDTENLRFMRGMFRNCQNITELDLSHFKTGKVQWQQEMFAGANSLAKISLGVQFYSLNDTNIPELLATDEHTGYWQNVGAGTEDIPLGNHVLSSSSLMATYQNSMADTYVWQPLAGESIRAVDSMIYVGDSWEPIDNFVLATDENGESIPFDESMVSGEVDTTTAGVYPVTYTNGSASQEINVTVEESQESLQVVDSTIIVGDTWAPSDNFVSATDKTGASVPFDVSMVSGEVDTTQVGEYKITYTHGAISHEITVTVVASQEAINATDSRIHTGDVWHPRDNFVSATNRAGETVPFDESMVSGTVDTGRTGNFVITYRNGEASQRITVTVVENRETIQAQNGSIYVGDTWDPSDQFVSATNKDGEMVAFDKSMVTGTVDTTKAGDYPLTYTNGGATEEVVVVVKENGETIVTKDLQLYIGDTWKPSDGFVSATNRAGFSVTFDESMVSGTVDTNKEGTYTITYTNGSVSETSQVTVSKRGAAGGNGNASGENQEKKQANSTATQQKKAQENTAKNLPKTGELQSSASILGLAIVSGTIAAYIYNKKKKRKT
ncbi:MULTISPECIES: bacterial Ig-like domain-containing protein [unclassified Enterococcus]|uniref:bacterial Ig-like domain-containing protein n=1 Tax=unclassified Enterococcus TaxID=2608891 RepID=UPI001A9C2722|nr:bacterial Ig-like domain-containing protein [Enterococcus sp. DIV1271a]MBO1299859.1 bacterial Ig-like domain-containing protein [Enterococcus sp. DIV1271a]